MRDNFDFYWLWIRVAWNESWNRANAWAWLLGAFIVGRVLPISAIKWACLKIFQKGLHLGFYVCVLLGL